MHGRSPPTPSGRVSLRVSLTLKLVAAVVTVAALAGGSAAAVGDIGYRGPHFSGTGTQITGAKPESKLWWNDGTWWAVMWDEPSQDNLIFRLDQSSHAWVNTGTVVDSRSGTRADVLWDGTRLYVASHGYRNTSQVGFAAHLYRFTYSATTKTYSLETGYPAVINDYRTETLVLDKDSRGRLWATWVQDQTVYVNATTTNDRTWGVPFALPVAGATTLNADDISSLVAFGDKIGVMWSNQTASVMYFAVHNDADARTIWRPSEAAASGALSADDHINLKADSTGRVFAAVKTSAIDPDAALVQLLVRDPATSGWSAYVYGRKSDHHTRPIVLLDEIAGTLHMFATSGEEGGTIYRKSTPMNSISFPAGIGTAFIRDAASGDVNDATSTKRSVSATTGITVLASDDTTGHFWHNEISGASAPALTADFTGTPVSGAAPLAVSFTDVSSGTPTSWSWAFGDGTTSTTQSPSHTYSASGTYNVTLTVTDSSGTSSTRTRSSYVAVGVPLPLVADFTGAPPSGSAPHAVSFTDASTGNPTTWSWSFGDGTSSSSRNPVHTYAAAGSYTVTLTVGNAAGATSTRTQANYVSVSPPTPPTASFSISPASGAAPLVARFTDTSTGSPTSRTWDFGDGTAPSTEQHPTHTYASAGSYTVTLTVTNSVGSDTETRSGAVTVDPPPAFRQFTPVADSWVSKTSASSNEGSDTALRVKFGGTSATSKVYETLLKFDLSGLSGAVSSVKLRLFVLDSGANGGTVHATSNAWTETGVTWANAPAATPAVLATVGATTINAWKEVDLPAGAVAAGGTYSLKIRVASAGDGTTWYSSREGTNAPQLVVATLAPPAPPPSASFTGSPKSGSSPLTVAFTETSTGNPTSWTWGFGDGTTSTQRHPVHTYVGAGSYTVTLTATNAGGSHTTTFTNYVTVSPPPPPAAAFTGTPTAGVAPLQVGFTDTSTGSPTSWSWDFGDGGTSTQRNPSHLYATAGNYTVTLTATNAGGSNTASYPAYVTVAPPPAPSASFTGTPTSGTAPLLVSFTDTSTGGPTGWTWNFGDGTASTEQHPAHTFTTAGTYTVTLTATNATAGDTLHRTGYVVVSPPAPPTASFTGTPTSGVGPLNVGFADTSTGTPTTWAWSFGDGATSTERDPSHTYAAAGTYSVALTVTNEGGSDTRTRLDYVTVFAPGSTIFSTVADAYVSSATPSTNYGTRPTLRVRNPGASGEWFISYLRFSVQNLGNQVVDAKLRLFVADAATNGGNVYTVADSSWTEAGLNWSNAPPLGALLANAGPTPLGAWVEIALPASAFTAGNGSYTFALRSDRPADGTAGFNSREGVGGSVNAPQLIVRTGTTAQQLTASLTGTPTSGTAPLAVAFSDTSTGSPTAWSWNFGDGSTSTQQHPAHTYANAGTYSVTLTVSGAAGSDTTTRSGYVVVTSPTAALSFVPVADTYVRSGAPTGNFGAAGTLRVSFGGATAETYRTYVRFNVTGLVQPVATATLRLYIVDAAANGGNVYTVSDSGWSETTLVWNNAPAVTALLANVGAAPLSTWVDVALPASAFAAGNGVYTFAVQSDSATNGTVWYASRETATVPTLTLTQAP